MVTVETSRSIMLSWDRPSLEEQNGILTIYHVIIMETQILYLDDGTVDSPMGNNFNRTYNVSEGRNQLVDMLHPSYNYTVMIAAATEPGIGPFSEPITVMTLEDGECCTLLFNFGYYHIPTVPLAPPQNVTVEVVSSQSIYVSWESPDITKQNGKIRSYTIRVTDLHDNNVTERVVPNRNITIEEVADRNITIEGSNILVLNIVNALIIMYATHWVSRGHYQISWNPIPHFYGTFPFHMCPRTSQTCSHPHIKASYKSLIFTGIFKKISNVHCYLHTSMSQC